jgi:hypothetical protein
VSGAGLDGVPGVRVNLVQKSLAGGPSSRGLTSGYTPRPQDAVLSGDRVSGRLKLLNKVLQVRTLQSNEWSAAAGQILGRRGDGAVWLQLTGASGEHVLKQTKT